jgi:quinol monooxygenase YgiN
MSNQVQYLIEWTIKPGGLDAFKEMAANFAAGTEANEPLTKGYQWYFNDDESVCYTSEWHTDSDSLMTHLGNVGDTLPGLLAHCDITRFEVFGNASPAATEALKGLGAVFFKFHVGFAR